jgi:hypothetical protein
MVIKTTNEAWYSMQDQSWAEASMKKISWQRQSGKDTVDGKAMMKPEPKIHKN